MQGLPPRLLLAARPAIAGALALTPGWSARVAANMTAALGPDGFRREHVRAYFRHLADLVAYSAIVYRSGVETPVLDRQWVHDPDSRAIYETALAQGKGGLMVSPHLIGHEVMAGTATRVVPVSVLVRKSPEPEYEALKQRWYAALGVEVLYRPTKKGEVAALAEMTSALRVLRKNRVLAITPDLIQKPGTGIPVRLFGRTAELPAGAFFLASRTGASLLPTFFHQEGERYRLWSHPPLYADPTADRDAGIAALAQEWATLFEAFVRDHPDMWQFWLDKRWSAWLANS